MLARTLVDEGRPATSDEKQTLARFSSWGAIPDVFDDTKTSWSTERALLRDLLSQEQWDQARRTTINAHYTDPAYVRQMWSTLQELGFDGGTVLEPGAGAGTFIGMAPESAAMVGVELDETTAAIAAAVYPHAQIRAESFADTKYPAGHFDAAIGNVPFGNVTLHDPVHNAGRHSLHDHFIIKSLALTRPGGMVAVLTSRYTLDTQNPAARREMSKMADLVGAVRLPSGAHRRAAGTEVVTDLLVFRRREPGRPAASDVWETVHAHQVDGEVVKTNAYFDTRPENVLGTYTIGPSQFGPTLYVTGDLTDVESNLRTALDGIVADARERSQLFTARSEESQLQQKDHRPELAEVFDGTLLAEEDGSFAQVQGGRAEPVKVPKSAAVEVRALLSLRDQARILLEMEAASADDTAELEHAREALRTDYERYSTKYGPLNRYTMRETGRVDDETGAPRMARITPTATRILRQDPFGSLVMALEVFDDEKQDAVPASLLSRRVVVPRPEVQGAETPSEAIALSMDRTGGIDLPLIAHLLGTDESEARAALGTLVYDDPALDRLVPAAEYLSGDIRVKLDAARAAAEADPDRFAPNVPALERVVPEPLTMEEIAVRMGAVWIDPGTHQQFLREILRDQGLTVENPMPGKWVVKSQTRRSILATDEWGTSRRPAQDVAEAVMEQRALTVYDELDDGKRILNPTETQAATEKAEKLQARFAEWVWEDAERAHRLTEEYNRRFNSIVLRDYTDAGDYLTFPGMAANFTPRPHQRAAVARMISEPAVLLAHEVGAGKTAEMAMGATEMRRMGLINKPIVVVPNHMLEQFAREWLQIYPQAKILAASTDDLAGDKRRLFVARAAANDWDAIIATRTAFERIPVSPAFEAEYIRERVHELEANIAAARSAGSSTVKMIEKAKVRFEEKLKAKLDKPADPGITFESSGIDYVIVDEAHDYKNLTTESNIDAAAILPGSGRATDLHLKMEYLRSRHGLRAGTLATATPLANSITEAHVMQRYLRPDLLQAAGVLTFDTWAATFGELVTEMEMGPAGGFRLKTRFSKFQNVPEMLRMWHVFADVKTAEDLGLPVPLLRARPDGERAQHVHVIPPTPALESYLEHIGQRAEMVAAKAVPPEEDNMLKIAGDGRKAALDMRMVGAEHAQPGSKLEVVAATILNEWQAGKDLTYLDTITGEVSENPGGLQIVFNDLGTPAKDRWDAYNELKRLLVAGGMHPDRIRFIHSARNDAEKGRLFAAARSGHVDVLLGSTGKMGTGVNVQARAIAMHNIDVPWRPADIQQRNGRGIRQGNQNAEIAVHNYVVERSFDAYMWQTVERKAKFIAQVMRGKLDVREMEDIGDFALSAAEAKALSSGNPLLLEQAQAADQAAKLERLERAHARSQRNLHEMHAVATQRAQLAQDRIEILEQMIPAAVPTDGDRFRAVIDGRSYDKRADAAAAIAVWARSKYLGSLPVYAERDLGELGQLGGFTIDMRTRPQLGSIQIVAELRGVPNATVSVGREEMASPGIGYVTRLENLTASLPRLLADQRGVLREAESTLQDAQARIGRPFPRADELAEAQQRLTSITAELNALAAEASKTAPAAAPTADAATAGATAAGARAARVDVDGIANRIDALTAPTDSRPTWQPNTVPPPTQQIR